VISSVVELLEYLYNNQLFTAITTNLMPKEVREKYGNRIADRCNKMMQIFIFDNDTYRENEPIYRQ
jgi:DNA replication protein DnaC